MHKNQSNIRDMYSDMTNEAEEHETLLPVIKLRNYSYHRTKVENLPITPKINGVMFFAYLHVTGITKTLKEQCPITGEPLYDVERVDNEERVIHFHVPSSEIPEEYDVVNFIEDGDWSFPLTEEEYLQLTEPSITSERDFILFNLNRQSGNNIN